MRTRCKVTDEQLIALIPIARSVTDVMKRLGYRTVTGGTHSHMSRRIKRLQLDTGHFITGAMALERFRDPHKQSASVVLVKRADGTKRQAAYKVRRALIERGVPYICNQCGVGPIWNDETLVLEIDHRNNDILDDTQENLRFLCPNCHSQLRHQMNKGKTTVTTGGWATAAEMRLRKKENKAAHPSKCEICSETLKDYRSRRCIRHRPQTISLRKTKIQWPPIEILLDAKQQRRVLILAGQLGVSDSAVHKRIALHQNGRDGQAGSPAVSKTAVP